MKTIFINRFYAPDASATSRMLTDLAVAMAKEKEVHVVTSRLCAERVRLRPSETLHGVRVHRVWTTSLGRRGLLGRACDYASFYLTAPIKLYMLARRGDCVVALTDPPLIAVPVSWVARWRKASLVNWLHDVFPEVAVRLGIRVAGGWLGRRLVEWRNRALESAAMNVVLGARMREGAARMGVDPAKIRIIHNWADGASLRPIARAANRMRTEWSVEDAFVVGYSGNLGRAHEFNTLLEAASALRDRSNILFMIIGGGAQKAKLIDTARRMGLSNVVFKPLQPSDRLDESLGAADVHIVTLRPELEGLVVPSKFYGIAAAGRPTIVIGDPAGEIGSLVRDAECGVCVEPSDVDGLVAAIRRFSDDAELRDRMGRNARRKFDERFDRPLALDAWRALLRSVARMSEARVGGERPSTFSDPAQRAR